MCIYVRGGADMNEYVDHVYVINMEVIGRVKNGVVYKGGGKWRDGAGGV